MEYKSSVMNIHDEGDDHCPTCRFLSGDRTVDTMMAVIRNLDHMLANSEEYSHNLFVLLGKMEIPK